jgi:ribonucleoside-triphosphate reductase
MATAETPQPTHVLKRDGTTVPFNLDRITQALAKAGAATGQFDGAEAYLLARFVARKLAAAGHDQPGVEQIQDLAEATLINAGYHATARAYIVYREQHHRLRRGQGVVVDVVSSIDEYLDRTDWRVNANANQGYSLGGLILNSSGKLIANYWLSHVYAPEVGQAHRDGDLHIHDLDMLSGYCAGWSLRTLLAEGLNGVPGKIDAAPPKHFSSAVGQIVNFLGTLQNEWAGAQAFSSFDTYLAPFVKKDEMPEKEVRQCIQSFIYGVNTPSRWGSQAPFTNITLDWVVPEDLKDKPAIVGGKEMDFTYGDCQGEMDVINKVFIELMIDGDAAGRGFQYPIPTYNITRDFDWDSPNTRLLFEMTARYGTPYFSNFVNSDLDPGDVRSMCCRLRLDKRELKKRGGGLFGSDEFTGSLGVVTINLPQIAYLAQTKQRFFERLDYLMDLAKVSLVSKRKVIQRLLDGGLFPYTKRYLSTLDNHFNTIGLCGMNECCLNFLGADISTDRGKEFAEEILDHMRDRLSDYQVETGELFNLEATPAESTSYRLARHDKEQFPDIITSGTVDPYYTNSSQLPVDFTEDVFEAMDHQESLQTKYTGGTVFHTFLGESVMDWRTCRDLVRTVTANYRIPYFTISPTFSVCRVHGYLNGEQFECPKCKAEAEQKLRDQLAALEAEREMFLQAQSA